jgi:hypothetical protein
MRVRGANLSTSRAIVPLAPMVPTVPSHHLSKATHLCPVHHADGVIVTLSFPVCDELS